MIGYYYLIWKYAVCFIQKEIEMVQFEFKEIYKNLLST